MTTDYQRPPVRVALMGLGRAMFTEHYPVFKAHPSFFRVVAACVRAEQLLRVCNCVIDDCRIY